MNSNIFLDAIKNCFEPVTTVETLRYELRLTVQNIKNYLFSRSLVYSLKAIVLLNSNDIPFQEMADEIISRVSLLTTSPVKKIICTWFVCSDKGGIYLHEAIAAGKERYGILRNTFVVFNTENGNVSFGPGHPRNFEMSRKLVDLLEQHKTRSRELWLHDMGVFFKDCGSILN